MKRGELARWLAVVILGIFAIAVFRPRTGNHNLRIGGFETTALAQSIADHGEFSNPFYALPTGPSAHLAPLYPAYLALFMKVFPTANGAGTAVVWASLLQLALLLMLLPFLAQRLGLGFWTGVVAGVAWILAGIPPIFLGESTLAALLIICAAFLMQISLAGSMSRNQVLLSGLIWGLLLLLQPVVILVLPFWLLSLHFRSHMSRLSKLALIGLPLLIASPWIVRNCVVFHRAVFIRDNLGLELAVSNNSCANAMFDVNQFGCFASTHPNMNYGEAVKVQAMGEVEYNRMRMKEALDWIRENPGRFVTLTGQRFAVFWFPPRVVNKSNGSVWVPWMLDLFTLLSIPGLILMWRNTRPATYVVGLWLVFYPLIYYIVQYLDRYRYPIFWASFLAGSYFVTELVSSLMGDETADEMAKVKLERSTL